MLNIWVYYIFKQNISTVIEISACYYIYEYFTSKAIKLVKRTEKFICFPTEVLFLRLIDPLDSGCHDTVPMSASGFWKIFYLAVSSIKVGFSQRYLAKSWGLLYAIEISPLNLSQQAIMQLWLLWRLWYLYSWNYDSGIMRFSLQTCRVMTQKLILWLV